MYSKVKNIHAHVFELCDAGSYSTWIFSNVVDVVYVSHSVTG